MWEDNVDSAFAVTCMISLAGGPAMPSSKDTYLQRQSRLWS